MTRTTAELRQYLAGEWLFDNDFKDTSGNGNHGTPTDIEWKPTSRGMKPRFNGSSSTIGYGNDISLNMTNQISYGGWVSFNDDLAGVNRFFIKGSAETQYEFYHASPYAITSVISTSDTPTGIYTIVGTLNPRTWYHIFCTYDGSNVRTYINGIQQNVTAGTGVISTNAGQFEIGDPFAGMFDDVRIYNTAITTTEILNLYNETKGEYGVMPAEHSFTHNPDDVIDASDAVGAWGTTKESTTELVDLSGNENIADIHGAMPTEGFIQGRRFDGVDDYLDCGADSSLDMGSDDFNMMAIFKTSSALGHSLLLSKGSSGVGGKRYELWGHRTTDAHSIAIIIDDDSNGLKKTAGETPTNDSAIHIAMGVRDGDNLRIYLNGIEDASAVNIANYGSVDDVSKMCTIGIDSNDQATYPFNGTIYYINLLSEKYGGDASSIFNTFARLPFWSVNYTDYPNDSTEYTNNLPYSSSIISSGTFKVDDDKLQCVSAGTITYRASYEFDGSEYIKVEIDGVEYAGTGTITQGNTTVSVAQGSNKVTIVIGTADTIDKVRIQFREEV